MRNETEESVQEDLERGGCGQPREAEDGLKPVRTRRGRAEALEIGIGSTLFDSFVKAHNYSQEVTYKGMHEGYTRRFRLGKFTLRNPWDSWNNLSY